MSFTSDDFEGIIWIKEYYNESPVTVIDADAWQSDCLVYTFIRKEETDDKAFTEFKPEYEPSQVMGCYRDFKWIEAELRVTSGNLSDYPVVLEDFLATNQYWSD